MQHHRRIDALKQYLLLVRLPNVFTAPSNILAGYFAAVPVAEANGFHLASLMVSSGLLYAAGIALNDYFDIEIDRRERPGRPLPSGRIPKGHALAIAVVAIVAANAIVALAVNPSASLAVSAALTGAIVAYDYRLKRGPAAAFAMGSTRFLNVMLGASAGVAVVAAPAAAFGQEGVAAAVFAAAAQFAYVVAIMMLSKKEAGSDSGDGGRSDTRVALLIVCGVGASVAVAGLFLLQFRLEFLVNLAIFAGAMAAAFLFFFFSDRRHAARRPAPRLQRLVKNMVLSIVVLDSVFVAGAAGLEYGLATLLLMAPAVLLARKLYVT